MGERRVLVIPNPALKQPAAPAGRPDPALARDLVDTMRVSPGCVGLAATQIGVSVRAFCLDVSGHPKGEPNHGLVVLFDPVLLRAEGAEVRREGCMSVPDFTATDNLGGRFLPQLVAVLMMLAGLALMVTGWLNVEIQGGQVPPALQHGRGQGKRLDPALGHHGGEDAHVGQPLPHPSVQRSGCRVPGGADHLRGALLV
jgi:hypothetical protein